MGNKDWEFRVNDRNFKVGDMLVENEFMPQAHGGKGAYTGNKIYERVTWILSEGFGLPEGTVIMSTEHVMRVRNEGNGKITTSYKKYKG